MTPERSAKLKKVLNNRQPDLTIVLENVFDPHNISAVMRTCDAVGIQDIFVLNTKIPRHKKFGEKSSSSAAKWLTVHQYDNAEECFNELKKKEMKIYATKLNDASIDLYEVNFVQPIAIVFGNEHSGVSEEIEPYIDGNIIIPQVGIIQSLNISVACAVTIYEAFRQKRMVGHYNKQSLSNDAYNRLWEKWSQNK